jgi:hypothetical protein
MKLLFGPCWGACFSWRISFVAHEADFDDRCLSRGGGDVPRPTAAHGCANGGSTRKSNAAVLRLGRPLSAIVKVCVSALTGRTSSSLLARLGKAPWGRRTTLARNISFPTAYISPPEAFRVQKGSVAAYMHMARGLVGSIQRPLQGWTIE